MPKNRAERAQIFQSFDALKGFREILKEQERIVVPQRTLSEEDLAELDRKIHIIEKGMIITLIHYDRGRYIKTKGMVSKINLDTRIIQIVKEKISLKNIIGIEIEEVEY